MHLRRSVLGLNTTVFFNKEPHHREGPELSESDLTNLTHSKNLSASGRPNARQQQHSKTIAQVTRCNFLRSWQRPILRDPTLNQKEKEDGHLTAESKHHLAVIQIHNWGVL